MNLLELQQRANVLVQKVNEYEASLTGTEIDETDTLNQHKYADLYSLRPVMKLLFGTTVDEKLNRTLDNDLPLRVFASSAPAWNSTFNLLSFNPGPTNYPIEYPDTLTTNPDGSLTNNTKNNIGTTGVITPITSQDLVIQEELNINGVHLGENISLLSVVGFGTLGTVRVDSAYRYTNRQSFYITYQDNSVSTIDLPGFPNVIVVNMTCKFNLEQQKVRFITKFIDGQSGEVYKTINVEKSDTAIVANRKLTTRLYIPPNKTINPNNTFIKNEYVSMDVGYKSDTHEFMNNIDMYNNYNMCQLDVTQNSVTDRDTRIKQGINYSYSSNIADALVTECQVANLFNWNTTSSTQIDNNTISVNRQVPGIVCYYLGNGYNSTFTATIPYSPRLDNINSINYRTPPYYGAFYRNGSDIETSQVGLQMGAEACRIFMPGLNYTRGKLESPQQIWQPEKLVGDDNIDKGFNWQGRAIYHELVFKNRRAGSSDAGVDFKPTLDNVADNDPQGLATRFALAQQKPYYHNRPWFNELDELYGKDAAKLAYYINNSSVSKTQDETFNKDLFTLEANLSLYNDGILSNLDGTHKASLSELSYNLTEDIQNVYIYLPEISLANTGTSGSNNPSPYNFSLNFKSPVGINGTGFDITLSGIAGFEVSGALSTRDTKYNISSASMPLYNKKCRLRMQYFELQSANPETKELNFSTARLQYLDYSTNAWTDIPNFVFSGNCWLGMSELNYCNMGLYPQANELQNLTSMDLSKFKITANNDQITIFSPMNTPGETPMTDEEFYKNYKLNYDTWASALNKPI